MEIHNLINYKDNGWQWHLKSTQFCVHTARQRLVYWSFFTNPEGKELWLCKSSSGFNPVRIKNGKQFEIPAGLSIKQVFALLLTYFTSGAYRNVNSEIDRKIWEPKTRDEWHDGQSERKKSYARHWSSLYPVDNWELQEHWGVQCFFELAKVFWKKTDGSLDTSKPETYSDETNQTTSNGGNT